MTLRLLTRPALYRPPSPIPDPLFPAFLLTRVITLARSDIESGSGYADLNSAPFAVEFLIGGFIGERVLAAQFLDRARESVAQLGAAGSGDESAAGLGREHFH